MKTILLGLLLTVSTLSQAQVVFEVMAFAQMKDGEKGEWEGAGGAIVLEEGAFLFHFAKTSKFIITSKKENYTNEYGNEIWEYYTIDKSGSKRLIEIAMNTEGATFVIVSYPEINSVILYNVELSE